MEDLVEAFHHDPSSAVQINGGGGLAHCGMLTRAQRMLAIPGLLDMVNDDQLSPTIMSYAYRALREITDETFGDESTCGDAGMQRTAPKLWRGFAHSIAHGEFSV